MTAEVAIMNKAAVALAADSAVTISRGGTEHQKVYDSEDKLFELTCSNPIGIMINSGMHFMETPLSVLIKRHRNECGAFAKVVDASASFLAFLRRFGATSPEEVKRRDLYRTLAPLWRLLDRSYSQRLKERFETFDEDGAPPVADLGIFIRHLRRDVLVEQIERVQRYVAGFPETRLVGGKSRRKSLIPAVVTDLISELQEIGADLIDDATRDQFNELAKAALARRVPFTPSTGVIIAGFGKDELFPTLVSYEVYGMIDGQLRLFQTQKVDVDRRGSRARVLPFAQKEMVDRFLYGLDDDIQKKITEFAVGALPKLREHTLASLDMEDADRSSLEDEMKKAEDVFLDSLRDETFGVLRHESEAEMNEMVELMPKPEMARMAEALVNLTSIKRRVSKGFETVGGPIDVAVISQAEGFVWVKRKHYFPAELNGRYAQRMRAQVASRGSSDE